jgi:PPOX class probable F420-dependent enzyme
MSVIPDSQFGNRVRRRLREEHVIWLTTVGRDGTPQPNPVWFLWEEDSDSLLVYNRTGAARLGHVAARPQVSANFDADAHGGDVMVLAGIAEPAPDAPPCSAHEAYLAKYRDAIAGIGSDVERFAADYAVPLRLRVSKVRGF